MCCVGQSWGCWTHRASKSSFVAFCVFVPKLSSIGWSVSVSKARITNATLSLVEEGWHTLHWRLEHASRPTFVTYAQLVTLRKNINLLQRKSTESYGILPNVSRRTFCFATNAQNYWQVQTLEKEIRKLLDSFEKIYVYFYKTLRVHFKKLRDQKLPKLTKTYCLFRKVTQSSESY